MNPTPAHSTSAPRAAIAACSIITRRYLSHARILAESFTHHESTGRFYLLIVDGLPEGVEAFPGITVLSPDDLQLPYLTELLFKYDVVQLCTAIKPTLLAMLMNRFGEERLAYIDPDIMLARPMDEVVAALEHSSIVLTPHIVRPLPFDNQHPSDQDILMAGAYNLGFIGLRKTTQTMDFLAWWEQRLRDGCRLDPAQGLMTDQKWIDLVPGLFSSTTILRDETYNVAYWNTEARRVLRCGQQFLVNARPLAFFHFSNFDPNQPLKFSRDHGREPVVKGTGLADLLEHYAQLQFKHGYRETYTWKYQVGTFDNGIPVSAPVRKIYLNLSQSARDNFGDPFQTEGESSFFHWITIPRSGDNKLSRFLMQVYQDRLDLQGAFPDPAGASREGFLDWATNQGPGEVGYDPRLVVVEESPAGAADSEVEYSEQVEHVRDAARRLLPVDAVVSVISKGDPQLLDLDGREARHFPELENGVYSGHYPRDGAEALDWLHAQIGKGVGYLLVPSPYLWWLTTYTELGEYLDQNARQLTGEEDTCRIYALGESAEPQQQSDEERIELLLNRRAEQVAELSSQVLALTTRLREFELLWSQLAPDSTGVKVIWRNELPSAARQPLPDKPQLLAVGDIRWLSHDVTGRVVSIILPVKIDADDLVSLRQSLASQRGNESIEVIGFVIGPADPRLPIYQGFAATILQLSPGDPRIWNANAARNLASHHARGELIVLLGDGVTPEDDRWLANLLLPFDGTSRVVAACSNLGKQESSFHLDSTAVRKTILRSIPLPEHPLVDGRSWASRISNAGFLTVCENRSTASRRQGESSVISNLLDAVGEGIAGDADMTMPSDEQIRRAFETQTASTGATAAQAAAAVLGRWLGSYIRQAAPLPRDGGN
jgi:hypothetical protein